MRGGGTLISEARPAWNDERGVANTRIPGRGLDEVFGARERELRSGDNVTFTMEPTLDGPLAPLAGRVFNGLAFAEHLEVTGSSARVLARFAGDGSAPGDPAVVMSSYGQRARHPDWNIPVRGVRAGSRQDARRAGEFLQRLIAAMGVTPEVRIDGAPGLVEARFLESADAMLLIAINHGDTPQRVTFGLGRTYPRRSGRTWRAARRSISCRDRRARATLIASAPAM